MLGALLAWLAGKVSAMLRSTLAAAFVLLSMLTARAESGMASYYSGVGSRGEMTCAHRTRAFGSMSHRMLNGWPAELSTDQRGFDRVILVDGRE